MKRVKDNRKLRVLILGGFLTLGIFFFYHQHCKIRDINTLCKGDAKRTPGLLVLIPLWLLTCSIYGIVWNVKVAKRLRSNLEARGIAYPISGSIVGWLTVFGRQVPFFILLAQRDIIHATNALAEWHNHQQQI